MWAEQERSAGQGFRVTVGIGQADEQAPPVVDQGDEAGRETATLHIVGHKPIPTPVAGADVQRHPQASLPYVPEGMGGQGRAAKSGRQRREIAMHTARSKLASSANCAVVAGKRDGSLGKRRNGPRSFPPLARHITRVQSSC